MRRALAQSFASIEFINASPYLLLILHFFNTNCRNISPRFYHPGWRHTLHVVANVIVAQQWNKVGYVNSCCLCFHTHRQLVAEESGGGTGHSREAEMFANLRRSDHVIFLKRDNPVYLFLPV